MSLLIRLSLTLLITSIFSLLVDVNSWSMIRYPQHRFIPTSQRYFRRTTHPNQYYSFHQQLLDHRLASDYYCYYTTAHSMRMTSQRHSTTSSLDQLKKLEAPAAERNKIPIWQIIQKEVLPRTLATTTTTTLSTTTATTTSTENATTTPTTTANRTKPTLRILEIASGSGVHASYMVQQLWNYDAFDFVWQTSDMEESHRASIDAYRNEFFQTHGPVPVVSNNDSHHATATTTDTTTTLVFPPPFIVSLNENGIVEKETQELLYNNTNAQYDWLININLIHISPWSATIGLMKVANTYLKPDGILLLYGPYKVNGFCVESNEKFDQSLQARNVQWGIRDLEAILQLAQQNNLQWIQTIEMPANNLLVLFTKKKNCEETQNS